MVFAVFSRCWLVETVQAFPRSVRDKKTLVVGCGNSELSERMCGDGFRDVLSVDTSESAIEQMSARAARFNTAGTRCRYARWFDSLFLPSVLVQSGFLPLWLSKSVLCAYPWVERQPPFDLVTRSSIARSSKHHHREYQVCVVAAH